MIWDLVIWDSPVKYLSSMPEKKFKRIENEINTYKDYFFINLKKINVNHRWSTQRKLRQVENFCGSAF